MWNIYYNCLYFNTYNNLQTSNIKYLYENVKSIKMLDYIYLFYLYHG